MFNMNNYLVRDSDHIGCVYGIIRLESEELWNRALNYVIDCRKQDGRHLTSDSELIEEYFQMNNIEYEWIDFNKILEL